MRLAVSDCSNAPTRTWQVFVVWSRLDLSFDLQAVGGLDYQMLDEYGLVLTTYSDLDCISS
jgi:hypothetical protein